MFRFLACWVVCLVLTVPEAPAAPVHLVAQEPVRISNVGPGVYSGGKPVRAERDGSYWRLAEEVTGSVAFEVR